MNDGSTAMRPNVAAIDLPTAGGAARCVADSAAGGAPP